MNWKWNIVLLYDPTNYCYQILKWENKSNQLYSYGSYLQLFINWKINQIYGTQTKQYLLQRKITSCRNITELKTKNTLILWGAHLYEAVPDTWWCLIFCTTSSMLGVRLWAEEILRTEWRCSSVRRLLCDVLFSFIKENSYTYTGMCCQT